MFLTLLVISFVIPPAANGNWPSFLGGAARQQVSTTSPPILKWSPDAGIAWQHPLPGHGQSSPVIWESHVYLTSVEGDNKDDYYVLCLDLDTGEELWRRSYKNSAPVKNSLYVSRAAPTPVVDATGIIVFFESGDCVAFTHTGESRWERNLADAFGPFENEFGLGASPCQSSDKVFLLLEHNAPGHLLALEKSSGKTAWQVERPAKASWSSPALIVVDQQPQVLVSSAGSVMGFDPQNGQQLWAFTEIDGNTATTPIDFGQGRFAVGASPGRNTRDATLARQSNCLMQVSPGPDGWEANKLWVAEDASPSWASPIAHRGLAYWINRAGVLFCYELEGGQQVFSKRTPQSCWATPIAFGDHIYLFGKDGLTTIIEAGPEFKIVAECRLWEDGQAPPDNSVNTTETSQERQQAAAMFNKPTVYGAATNGDVLILRIGNRVYCIQPSQA